MRHEFVSPALGRWIISVLLVALCVRALVPAGFMPSSERPFSFQICPDGFPAELLTPAATAPVAHDGAHAHHHHDAPADSEPASGSHHHDSARAEHCVFAAAAGAGPAPEGLLLGSLPAAQSEPASEFISPVFSTLRFRLPQSRAPPALS